MIKRVGVYTVDHEVNATFQAGMNTVSRSTDSVIHVTTSVDKTIPELLLIVSKWLMSRSAT